MYVGMIRSITVSIPYTVIDLISEHTLISGHLPFFFFFFFLIFFFVLIILSSEFREGNTNLLYTGLMVTLVKTITRAQRYMCICCVIVLDHVIVLHHAIDI